MRVHEAIAAAKQVIGELFASEGIIDLNLEEVAYREQKNEWHVAISFLRPPAEKVSGALGNALMSLRRSRKLVRLRANGELIAVTDLVGSLTFAAA